MLSCYIHFWESALFSIWFSPRGDGYYFWYIPNIYTIVEGLLDLLRFAIVISNCILLFVCLSICGDTSSLHRLLSLLFSNKVVSKSLVWNYCKLKYNSLLVAKEFFSLSTSQTYFSFEMSHHLIDHVIYNMVLEWFCAYIYFCWWNWYEEHSCAYDYKEVYCSIWAFEGE
jgi:hypothetical protein